MRRIASSVAVILFVALPLIDLAGHTGHEGWSHPMLDRHQGAHCPLHETPTLEPDAILSGPVLTAEHLRGIEALCQLPLITEKIFIPPRS
jgi:hypothetical protein